MSVRTTDTLQKYKHYRQKEGLVIVKFGAVWCGPCNKIKPFMEELAAKNKHIYFLDVDVNSEVGDHDDVNNVRTIPHFKFFVDGKLKREIIGVDKEKLIQYVDRYGKEAKNVSHRNNKITKPSIIKPTIDVMKQSGKNINPIKKEPVIEHNNNNTDNNNNKDDNNNNTDDNNNNTDDNNNNTDKDNMGNDVDNDVDNDKLNLVVEIIKDKIESLVKNMSDGDTNKIRNEIIKYLLDK
jgi:thiol-disulfide isomerase/thioredoxin